MHTGDEKQIENGIHAFRLKNILETTYVVGRMVLKQYVNDM